MPKYGFCNNNKIQCVRQSSRGGAGVRRNMFSAFTQTNIDNTYTPGSGVGAVSRASRRALLRRAANKKCCPVKEEQDPFFLIYYDQNLGENMVQSIKSYFPYIKGSILITVQKFNEMYEEISGTLLIGDSTVGSVEILLKQIGGAIGSQPNNQITSLNFPNLTTCGSIAIQRFSTLTTLSFPVLATITPKIPNNIFGNIYILGNSSLLSISFPELTYVNRNIDIYDYNGLAKNKSLTSISYPKLTFIGEALNIFNNGAPNLSLKNISFPSLTTINTYLNINLDVEGEVITDSFKSIGLLSNNQGVKNINGLPRAVFINKVDAASADYLKTIFISGQTVNGEVFIQ